MASTVTGGGGGSIMSVTGNAKAEENYAASKTSVWWDIENCQVPKGFDAYVIAKNIRSSLDAMHYRGPVSISAYGDTKLISPVVQQALSSTGISLNHVPGGIKDASDKKILVDMLFWAVDNQPPANYLLISGDRDFSNALHQLSMRRYNILLAQPRNVSQALTIAAKTVWSWTDLLHGRPPLSPATVTTENVSTSEANRNSSVEETRPCDSLSSNPSLAHQKSNANGKVDNQVKGKQQTQKINRQPTGSKAKIVSKECVQYHSGTEGLTSITQTSQAPNKPLLNTEALPKARTNYSDDNPSIPQKPLVNSPHKYNAPQKLELKKFSTHESMGAAKPITLEPYPANDKVSVSNNFSDNQIPPHSLSPLNVIPSRPYQQFVNFSHSSTPMPNCYPQYIRHNAPAFIKETPRPNPPAVLAQSRKTSAPIAPDMSKLNITQFPNDFHHNTSHPNIPQNMLLCYQENMQGNYVSWNHSGPYPSVQSLMDNILSALRILRTEMITPTEANITDCIRYGELNIQDFDVRKALELAIQHHVVIKHKVGNNLFYASKGEPLWQCVNVMDSQFKHPKKVCDAVLKFLSSTDGHSSMMASRSMYDAAYILRLSCLKNRVLGDVLQILNAAIHQKKWIVPHPSGWQPLSLLLCTVPASDVNTEPPST